MNAVSIRGDWVGQTIDGKFRLLAWLGGSGTSGVFVTELDGEASPRAAIKLISASAQAEDRLANWATHASLSHPHLVKVLYFGRAEVDGTALVYVVTELAEEILAQIIPERALTADETREMLGPVLEALSYLHGQGLVHGHLKPSNILVVENEVKLSADGLLTAGEPAAELLTNEIHNAPETAHDSVTPAADIWSLGISLVEALAQQQPIWDSGSDAEPIVPASVPKPFDAIANGCLRTNPSQRSTIADVRSLLQGKRGPVAVPPRPQQAPLPTVDSPSSARFPLIPLLVGLVLIVAVIVGLAIHSHGSDKGSSSGSQTGPVQSETAQPQQPAAQPGSPADAAPPAPAPQSGGTAKGSVANRVLPDVPSSASNTIHGKVGVAVRVNVDASGTVTDAEMQTAGPSKYFARLALESARNWKFTAPEKDGRAVASTWILHYEFRRDGVDVNPVESTP